MLRVKNDDGAVAIIAALVIGFLSLALLALTIDVGQMYAERRELQNGADAAVVAVARELTADPTLSNSAANAIAEQYAGKNALDARSMGEAFGPMWGTAAPYSDSVYGMSAPPAGLGYNYVEVRTATESSSGGPLDFFFHSGGATISAFARAAWGSLGRKNGLAVTLSHCEWKAATSNNTVYPPPPPYTSYPSPSATLAPYEVILKLKASDTSCSENSHTGANYPGGFGWLDDDGPCMTEVEIGDPPSYGGSTGNGKPNQNGCADVLPEYRQSREVVYIPIFNGTDDHVGGQTDYYLEGFAAFVVTGYDLPGVLKDKSWVTGEHLSDNRYGSAKCGSGEKCLSGFFTEALVSGTPGGADFGVTTQPTLVR
jgi:hypothetical protein